MSSSLSTLDSPLPQEAPAPTSEAAFLGQALRSAARFAAGQDQPTTAGQTRKARWVSVSIPAPETSPERFLRLAGTDHGLLWVPPGGNAAAGSGAAARIEVSGGDRIEELRRRAAAVLDSVAVVRAPGVDAPPPRFFGGLAFEAGSADADAWRPFGDGSFLLPRWLYTVRDGGAALTYTGSVNEILERGDEGSQHSPNSVQERAEALLLGLATTPPRLERPLPAATAVRQLPPERWAEMVEAIREEIRRGRFQKIVAARCSEVEFSNAVDPLALLSRLDGRTPNCLRFAFFRDDSCFLGATPERLVRKGGPHVATEALAGSIAAGPGQKERLMSSDKDRWEHELVVRHVVERLQDFCAPLDWCGSPRIRALRTLLHLHTPVRGQLRRGAHVLDLVEALHPTPAVGGVPASDARRWIAQREASPRGWYAGPIGWLDGSGDGEFDIALRSCLVRGNKALVYAGAGIVADSDPEAEYRETDLKQRSLLAALGVTD